MNAFFAIAAAGFAALLAVSPVGAAQLVDGFPTNSFGTVPDATMQGTYGNPQVAPGGFSETFNFTVLVPGHLASKTVSSTANSLENAIQGLTITLTGPTGVVASVSDIVADQLVGFASFTNVLLAQVGAYVLTVSGTAGLLGSAYSGTYSFSPSPIPIPGALALFGSALLGGAGFMRLRRRLRVQTA